MAYNSGNREQDQEQDLLQQQLGGQPVSQTQPVGQPLPEAAPQQAAPDNGQASRDALGGYAGKGTMLGFNQGDYGGDVKARNSVKNTFGRIASRYDAKPSSMKLIAQDPDFQRYFPGARFDDKDRLHLDPNKLSDFEGGVGGMGGADGIDVLGSADVGSDSAAGWTWQDSAHDGGGQTVDTGGFGGGMDPMMLLQQGNPDQLAEGDILAQILQSLQQQSGGGGQGEQQLLQSLLGGQ
jgi:hypothetical protein